MRHFFNVDYLIETIQYNDRAHLKIMWLELDVDGKSYKCGREIIEHKKKIMKWKKISNDQRPELLTAHLARWKILFLFPQEY